MRILITGAQGMLGQAVSRLLAVSHEVVACARAQLDVTDEKAVRRTLSRVQPDWTLHLAALTDVDRCQREPQQALLVNTQATEYLVDACRQVDAGLLFLSSIAVFDGKKPTPYRETDSPQPINQYGLSKHLAEQAVATLPRHLIVRSGWLFGGGAADKKFVSKILSLAASRPALDVVADKVGSPTYVGDLAIGLPRLLKEDARGLFHLVNAGPPASRFALAQAIVNVVGLRTEIRPVSSNHFPELAPRPDMEAATSRHTGDWLPTWQRALDDYVSTMDRVM